MKMNNKNNNNLVPIIIPAYEPGEDFISICKDLYELNEPIIVVDDGSGEEYSYIFDHIKSDGVTVLTHYINLGKGRALKYAFNYVLCKYQDVIGVVTADSDGQHNVNDIKKCILGIVEKPDKLLLGTRDFSNNNIPWKSKFGNTLTRKVCGYLCGIHVSDTQTGLRGIPREFLKSCLLIQGERFEFETNVLIESKGKVDIWEVPIETIYKSKDNHKTHFDPIIDSIKIYAIFVRIFGRFVISSLSSSIVDLALFSLLCWALRSGDETFYVVIATVLARAVSACCNYLLNYKFVFRSNENVKISGVRYFLLAVTQMLLSAALVTVGVILFNYIAEVWIKAVVDTILFFVSYKIQQKFVFGKNKI